MSCDAGGGGTDYERFSILDQAGGTVMLALRYGIARGLFSNEAGLGSAPLVHSAAYTDHPIRQGMYGIFEVFVDTLLICSTTGLVILVTGPEAKRSPLP